MKRNIFTLEHSRGGVVLARQKFHNLVATEGKDDILDVYFSSGTASASWYIGLIKASPTPTFNVADTLASHSGWTEATGFTSARVLWDEAAASGGSKGTSTASVFTSNATDSIKGMFVCNVASGTSGKLWSMGTFDQRDIVSGDDLRVEYTVSGF